MFDEFDEYDDMAHRSEPLQPAVDLSEPISWSRLRRWLAGSEETGETAATELGRAIHMRILQPDLYKLNVIQFEPPVNPATGSPYGGGSKKHADAIAAIRADAPADAIVLSKLDAERVENAAAATFERGFSVEKSDCVEQNIEAEINLNGLKIKLRGRPDFFSARVLVELKTTSREVATFYGLDQYYWKAVKSGYLHQLAFYSLILGYDNPLTLMYIVETNAPHRVSVAYIKPETLAQKKYEILEKFLPAYVEQKHPKLEFSY